MTVLRQLCVAAAAALALSACTPVSPTVAPSASPTTPSRATTIHLVAAEYSDATKDFWDRFARTYEEKTDFALTVELIAWDAIDQRSAAMVQTGSAPDVLNLNVYAGYADDGLLWNAEEVLTPAAREDLLGAFLRSGTYNGQVYGFPSLSSTRALFYNKDLFAKAGILTPPATWAEFEAAAKKVTALRGNAVGYALPLGPEEAQAEFSIWAFNNGGDWKTDGRWTVDSPENLATLTFLRKLALTDKVTQPDPAGTDRQRAFDLFAAGKAGMVVGYPPLGAVLDEAGKVDYGVAPMPTTLSAPQTFGVTDYLMAFKREGNQDAVRAFFELFYAPDQINTYIKAEGFLPVTKSGLEVFAVDPALSVYIDTMPNVHLTPTNDPTWDKVKRAVQRSIGEGVTAEGTPGLVLEALQRTADTPG